jgi:prepilin peptidase CpaA
MFSIPPRGAQLVLVVLVLIAAFCDARTRRIPNWLTLSGVLAGVALNTFLYPGLSGLWLSLKGLALGFGVYLFLHLLRAMGAGDVKLMAAVGAVVGPSNWIAVFTATAIVSGAAAIVLMAARGRVRRTLWNIGYILSELILLRPPYLRRSYLDVKHPGALTLPHGIAIAAGTVFCIVAARIG